MCARCFRKLLPNLTMKTGLSSVPSSGADVPRTKYFFITKASWTSKERAGHRQRTRNYGLLSKAWDMESSSLGIRYALFVDERFISYHLIIMCTRLPSCCLEGGSIKFIWGGLSAWIHKSKLDALRRGMIWSFLLPRVRRWVSGRFLTWCQAERRASWESDTPGLNATNLVFHGCRKILHKFNFVKYYFSDNFLKSIVKMTKNCFHLLPSLRKIEIGGPSSTDISQKEIDSSWKADTRGFWMKLLG